MTAKSETKKRERGIDIDVVSKMIADIKIKSPENARILTERLSRFVDARDEKRDSAKSLKEAIRFLRG